MAAGVPFKPSKESVIACLVKFKGKISLAAKEFDVERYILREFIKRDPDLVIILEQLRLEYAQFALDAAEDTLLYALQNRDKDLASAIKASQYILNNIGRERGYKHPALMVGEAKYEANKINKADGTLQLIDTVEVIDGNSNTIHKATAKHSGEQCEIQHLDRSCQEREELC